MSGSEHARFTDFSASTCATTKLWHHPVWLLTSLFSLLTATAFAAADESQQLVAAPNTPAEQMVARTMSGWTVQLDQRLIDGPGRELGDVAIRLLEAQLFQLTLLVPASRLSDLKRVTIWMEWDHPQLGSMQYHPSRDWLIEHGHDPRLERCVHIPRARDLVDHIQNHSQPLALLHELAHAYHDQVLGFDHPEVAQAWARVRDAGRWTSVLHISGRHERHYALTNPQEFFAELTESLFGTNDFFPFVRGELALEDPEVCQLMMRLWDFPKQRLDQQVLKAAGKPEAK